MKVVVTKRMMDASSLNWIENFIQIEEFTLSEENFDSKVEEITMSD